MSGIGGTATREREQARTDERAPAAAVIPGGTILNRSNWTAFADLPSFSIRNGQVSQARSMLLKPTIPEGYHWVPISGLNPEDAMKALDLYVVSALAQLEAYSPVGMSATRMRKVAIALGVVRATSTQTYTLASSDFIPGELTGARVKAEYTENGNITFTTVADGSLGSVEGFEFTREEQTVVSQIVLCALGVIPMQGYSLMMTQHHYLSDGSSQSRKVYVVPERAFLKPTSIGDWFESDKEILQDALWHKACHPVSVLLKTRLAVDPRVAAMIREAGAGACASRLPAKESELRTANSYITLLSTVAPIFTSSGGSLDYSLLLDVVDFVEAFPVGEDSPAMPEAHNLVVPAGVKNRVTALAWLGEVLKRNADPVALCFGFYCALSEGIVASTATRSVDTLRTSNSLGKLENQSRASFIAGNQLYADYSVAQNKKRAEGKYTSPRVVMS